MKLKKILSVIFSMSLIFSVMANGAYAGETSDDSSNVNLYIYQSGQGYTYLVKSGEVVDSSIDGMTYDDSVNTLTLNGYEDDSSALYIYNMGEDFTITVEGTNSLYYIAWYSGDGDSNVTIDGTGELALNENLSYTYGLYMGLYGNDCTLTIEDTVSMDVYGSSYAAYIYGCDSEDLTGVIVTNGDTNLTYDSSTVTSTVNEMYASVFLNDAREGSVTYDVYEREDVRYAVTQETDEQGRYYIYYINGSEENPILSIFGWSLYPEQNGFDKTEDTIECYSTVYASYNVYEKDGAYYTFYEISEDTEGNAIYAICEVSEYTIVRYSGDEATFFAGILSDDCEQVTEISSEYVLAADYSPVYECTISLTHWIITGSGSNSESDQTADKTASSESSQTSSAQEQSEATSVTSGGITYEILNKSRKTAAVTSVSKKIKKAIVKASVNIDGKKYKVTKIKAGAFRGCSKLKSVTIGKNVKNIGKKAFFKCLKLKKVTIKGKSLKKVGKKAFSKTASGITLTAAKKKKKKYKKLLKKAGAKL